MTVATIQPVLIEGALTFTFPPQSTASKYDDWAHYRNQFQTTCGGSKAVDMVYTDGQMTWIIEVKDFRQHQRVKQIDLSDEIALKVRDTLAGLVSAKFHANDPDEKRCATAILRSKKIRVVCHIEQPAKHSRLFPRAIEPDNLALKLRTLIKAIDPHPAVVDRHSLHADMPWNVQ
jgi:hypothetical protein